MLDDDLLISVNGSPRAVTFTIPETGTRSSWRTELDSFDPPLIAQRPGRPAPRTRPAPSPPPAQARGPVGRTRHQSGQAIT